MLAIGISVGLSKDISRNLPPPPPATAATVPGTADIVAFQEHRATGEEQMNEATILAMCTKLSKMHAARKAGKFQSFDEGHGATTVLLKGELVVTADDIARLPCDALRVGLLQGPGRYPAVARFNYIDKVCVCYSAKRNGGGWACVPVLRVRKAH